MKADKPNANPEIHPLAYSEQASNLRRRAIGVDGIALLLFAGGVVLFCSIPFVFSSGSESSASAGEVLTRPIHWAARAYVAAVFILPAILLVVAAWKLFRRRRGFLRIAAAMYVGLAVVIAVLWLLPEVV